MTASDIRAAQLAILNAPFEERGWERAVQAVADATRSHAAQLLGIGGPMVIPLNVFVGSPASYRRYIENRDLHGPCNWRVGSTTAPMAIQHDGDYAAYRAHRPTSDYDDAASDMDIQFGCQSALMLDSHSMIGLAALRGRRDGPCTSETLSAFSHLRHHMARAIRMQLALDNEAAQLMLGNLETMHCATILLDRHAVLAEMTPAAESLFELGGPLRLIGLSVQLANPMQNRQFQMLVAALLHHDEHGHEVAEMRIGNGLGCDTPAWRLIASRLPRRENGLGFEPAVAITVRSLSALNH